MRSPVRVQVLMRLEEASGFERYCESRGHKKSTLIARSIREHLDREEPLARIRSSAGAER